jgi:hypothetical protein
MSPYSLDHISLRSLLGSRPLTAGFLTTRPAEPSQIPRLDDAHSTLGGVVARRPPHADFGRSSSFRVTPVKLVRFTPRGFTPRARPIRAARKTLSDPTLVAPSCFPLPSSCQ